MNVRLVWVGPLGLLLQEHNVSGARNVSATLDMKNVMSTHFFEK